MIFSIKNGVAALLIATMPLTSIEALTKYPAQVPEFEEVSFVATAYYSPLPNQKYYLRGNYEKEVILNGK